MGMLVPAAVRRENQIAVFHDHFFAVNVGIGAVALKNEAKRTHRMAVGGSYFAGLNQLKRQQNRMAGHLRFGESRVHQSNYPPFDAAAGDANLVLRPKQAVVDIVPFPKMGLYARSEERR